MKSILKTTMILCLILTYGIESHAQKNVIVEDNEPFTYIITNSTDSEERPVFDSGDVDVKAEFPGGIEKLVDWLRTNVVYPKAAVKENVSGKASVVFIVNEDGSILVWYVEVTPDREDFLNEALRICQNMPRWIPAKINGKHVRSIFRLPITFKL